MYNEQKQAREEVLIILNYALNYMMLYGDDKFCCPNGSIWSYEEVKEYIEKNLK